MPLLSLLPTCHLTDRIKLTLDELLGEVTRAQNGIAVFRKQHVQNKTNLMITLVPSTGRLEGLHQNKAAN